MGSQLDLDQGGTPRQWVRTYMGPTIGWVQLPGINPYLIPAAGTYSLISGTSLVVVNLFSTDEITDQFGNPILDQFGDPLQSPGSGIGPVTIILPSAQDPRVPAGVQPGLYAKTELTVIDVGGTAGTSPITIKPFQGNGDSIMGLTQIQIVANFGSYTLKPNSTQKVWTGAA